MKRKKWLQVVILFFILVIGGYAIVTGLIDSQEKAIDAGDELLDFTLTDLDGNIVSLADYKGKAIMLNFWGTFCPPCVYEMPLFQKYYERHKDDGLVILAVNLNEPPVTVRRFVKEHGLTFPILLDKEVVRKQYGVKQYPTTFFVNRQGIVVSKIDRIIDERILQPLVEQILKEI